MVAPGSSGEVVESMSQRRSGMTSFQRSGGEAFGSLVRPIGCGAAGPGAGGVRPGPPGQGAAARSGPSLTGRDPTSLLALGSHEIRAERQLGRVLIVGPTTKLQVLDGASR